MTGAITAILGVLKALPEIISLFKTFYAYLQHATGNDVVGYISDTKAAVDELKDAKTPEQKLEAAKKLQGLIGRL